MLLTICYIQSLLHELEVTFAFVLPKQSRNDKGTTPEIIKSLTCLHNTHNNNNSFVIKEILTEAWEGVIFSGAIVRVIHNAVSSNNQALCCRWDVSSYTKKIMLFVCP